jgi:hypothetical protein
MLLLASTVLALVAPSAGGAPPPGATARCRDGTYSYSQHHSGTCSHHGGVAAWLDGSSASPPRSAGVALGHTVLLQARTRTRGCRLSPNPDRRCSPGAYYTGLSKRVICSPGFHTSTVRNVPQSEKYAVEREYGLAPAHYGRTLEIDHIVSLELGGSNSIANLYPEEANAHPGYQVKDKLENRLHDLVCAGQISLSVARHRIAADWEKLYKLVYGVAPTG